MDETIIIGAGAAGLAAGQRLRAAGHPALIVEARARVGGRIWTDHSHGPAELGAEFIHGDRALTWEHVRAAGLHTTIWQGPRRFAAGGALLPPDDPAALRTAELFEAATSYSGPDLSVVTLIDRLANPAELGYSFALRWLANMEGADTARLSAAALSRERAQASNGEYNFHIHNGYDRFVRQLADGLTIQLNSPVERITWEQGTVRLTLASGDALSARRVIVTIPLGVLQARPGLFAPELPTPKRTAIERIAMGHVTKLLLWFERQFWPDFTVLSTDGRVATWWPVESAAVPALMGYTGGPAALALAALGEEGAITTGLAELGRLFGADVAAASLGGRMADWSRDPWSLGAYSYSPLGMGDARAALAASLAGTLYFAGEATLTNGHLATVHGALESGARAADEVLAAG